MYRVYILLILVSMLFVGLCSYEQTTFALQDLQLSDSNLIVHPIIENLPFYPTSMVFLNQDDILTTDKDSGEVRRIINGSLLPTPLIKLNVTNEGERGLLGMTIDKDSQPINVYLYLTEAKNHTGDSAKEPIISNRIYKLDFINNSLINPKVIFDLPALPGPIHNGGALITGPDNNLYFPIGDLSHQTEAQNIKNGSPADLTGGILRITKDGKSVADEFSFGSGNLSYYYAYGIRNSFGIDFDPITGNLWDTENGEEYGDEVNIVPPGFNGGWKKVSGLWVPNFTNTTPHGAFLGQKFNDTDNLVNLNNKGKYKSPEFMTGNFTIAPTAIKFLSSDKIGTKYENSLFVGDVNNGNIYSFNLNENRTGLELKGALADKIANTMEELNGIVFAKGVGLVIMDMEEGPDGFLYILSGGNGAIYKIMPRSIG